jgi:hypothetical protein
MIQFHLFLLVFFFGLGLTASSGSRQAQGGDIDVLPMSLDFGSVMVGESQELRLTIRNTGTTLLTVNSIGSSNPQFAVVTPSGAFTVNPAVKQAVTIRFMPTTGGAQSATVSIRSSDPDEATVSTALAGTGSNTVTSQWTFPRDGTSGWREVNTRNVPGAWSPDAQGLVGSIADNSGYSFFFPPITAARQKLSVSSAFSFIQGVDYNAAGVGIISSDSMNGRQTNLRCELSERENHLVLHGWVNGNEGNISGSVAVRLNRDIQLNMPHTVILEVEATTARCLLDGERVITATVADLANFPSRIHPMLFIIESRARFAGLTVTSVEDTVLAPDIDVTPTSLDFGSVNVGQTKDLMLTVRNTGGAPLTVNSMVSMNQRFSVTSASTPFTLAAGGEQAVTVRFAPTAAGAQAATLAIMSDDPDEAAVSVALAGAGVAASSGPDIDVTPTRLDFGSVPVGQSATLTVTVRNLGTATLTLNSITTNNSQFIVPFLLPQFRTVAPGGGLAFTVLFMPTTAGAQSGTVTITSNDPDEATVHVPMTGTGSSSAAITMSRLHPLTPISPDNCDGPSRPFAPGRAFRKAGSLGFHWSLI